MQSLCDRQRPTVSRCQEGQKPPFVLSYDMVPSAASSSTGFIRRRQGGWDEPPSGEKVSPRREQFVPAEHGVPRAVGQADFPPPRKRSLVGSNAFQHVLARRRRCEQRVHTRSNSSHTLRGSPSLAAPRRAEVWCWRRQTLFRRAAPCRGLVQAATKHTSPGRAAQHVASHHMLCHPMRSPSALTDGQLAVVDWGVRERQGARVRFEPPRVGVCYA